jgi:predicted small lipoprotein YifL
MKPVLLCLAGAVPLAFTVGCGQKGPLYLPPKNGTVVTRPAGSAGAPPQTNQSSSPQETTTLPSTTTSESTPSGTLKQDSGPATQGAKPPPDKNDKDSSTAQAPKRF